MHPTLRRAATVLTGLAVLACGSDGTGPDPDNGNASMTATVDGQNFAPHALAIEATYAGNLLVFAGSVTAAGITQQINITLTGVTGPGNYSLGPSFGGNIALFTSVAGGSTSVWTTSLSPASGTVTISTLDAEHVAGTFAFTAQFATGGATGQKAVTSGSFAIDF